MRKKGGLLVKSKYSQINIKNRSVFEWLLLMRGIEI